MQGDASEIEWLSLKDAASRLGIHATTLRRWADNGEIPVMMTPGGHRRFAISDLDRFAEERRRLRIVSGIERLWAERTLDRTRTEIQTHPSRTWLQPFDEKKRELNRALGRRLMGVILQYVSLDAGGEAPLEEARNIGIEYAAHAIESGLPLMATLEAAMFFRDSMVEVAVQLPEQAHLRPEANAKLLRRITAVLNAVQLAIVSVYDTSKGT